MALNFNLLAQEGPKNLYEGFEQGRQAVAQNALAQQKLAQEGELMSMRRQEFQANLESSRAERRRKAAVEKTAMFRDRILRAPTPQAARELVRMQHSDPDLGPVMQQLGSLDQDLADIPDDPTGFESWRQREAMGAAEFIKSQASERGFQDLLKRVRGGQQGAAAPAAPSGELVAAPITPPAGVMREIAPGGAMGAEMPLAPTNALAPVPAQTNAMAAPASRGRAPEQIRAEIDQLSMSSDPRAVRMVQTLTKEYEAALRGDQNRPMAVSPGQVVIDPRTGQQIFNAPGKTTLSERFVPVGRLVFDRETRQYISPSQAQLAQSQERPATAAPGGKAPAGYRFTPTGDLEPIPGGPAARAAEVKPLTPAQEIKRRDTLGKEFKIAQSALQTTQDVLDSIAFVKSEPGLSRATGFIGTMLPSFPEGQAASAETRLKNLEGKITALGKAQAASTGAIGSIANQEWKILADQIAAIDRTKGTGPLLAQLELVEAQAQGAMERIRDGYQRQFGEDFERFPQYSDLPPPKSSFKPRTPAGGKPAAAGGLSPAEQAELDQLRKQFRK